MDDVTKSLISDYCKFPLEEALLVKGPSAVLYSNYSEEKMSPVKDARLHHTTLEPVSLPNSSVRGAQG